MNQNKAEACTNENLVLSKISHGDQLAFRVIFDLYRKKVYSYALKMIKSATQAEDIVHDVFLKIWLQPNLGEIQNFEAYLKTITRNHTLKMLRRQQLELKTSYDFKKTWTEAHNETEESLLLNDSSNILKKGIDLLPPQQKLVYYLCREQGLKYEDAASQLSISPFTVKTHMQHALRFLRGYLSKHTDIALILVLTQILTGA